MLREGDLAPDFTLPDQDGRLVTLSELRGHPVVLYFHHAVAERYGTWVEKHNYGRRYWGVQRATFVIDPAGVVARVFPKVSPKTHDEQVLAALAQLERA